MLNMTGPTIASPAPESGDASAPDDGDTLGGRIVRAREAMGLSTAQLARRLGVKTTTMAQWESDRSEPRSNRLHMLSGLLAVSPMWLLAGRGDAPDEDAGGPEARLIRSELAQLVEEADRLATRLKALAHRAEGLGRTDDAA